MISQCFFDLQLKFPQDLFEFTNKKMAVDSSEEPQIAPIIYQPLPPNLKWMYLPGIIRHDCTDRLYKLGPCNSLNNFELHLNTNCHWTNVSARLRHSMAAHAGTTTTDPPSSSSKKNEASADNSSRTRSLANEQSNIRRLDWIGLGQDWKTFQVTYQLSSFANSQKAAPQVP